MLKAADAKRHLHGVWLFSDLDERELSRVAALSRERACGRGQTLVAQGDCSDDLYCIIAGRLKVSSIAHEGNEVLLSLMGPGEVLGELALLDQKPRSANVTAVELCRLLVVPGAPFRALLLEVPTLALKLLQVMATHVRRLSRRAEDVATLDVKARLAKALVDLADRFGTPGPRGGTVISIRLSQQELGRLVGATREMVNKCLRGWARQRIVRQGRGPLVILNRVALEALSETPDAT